MFSSVATILGGIGLFLVGMRLLSDGLEAAAGHGLRRGLERAASSRMKAFASGALITALVQSSSATTVATIGFVSAGLLTVGQSLGVVIGANVGTTSTGWLVTLAGFKVSLGTWMLPMVGLGALFHLVVKTRKRHLGLALAGFGLIFVGIDFLQDGMGGLAAHIDFSRYSAASWDGKALLVLSGLVITALVQSSSVAVALSLTALGSGAIDLNQAAYLVVGQNLGTTVTAVLASLGATIPARRTALGHILFNVLAGAIAFGAAPWFLDAVHYILSPRAPDVIRIALFHTLFNVVGAAVALPAVPLLARAVNRIIPERAPSLTRHLDKSLLTVPSAALEASSHVVRQVASQLYEMAARALPADFAPPDDAPSDDAPPDVPPAYVLPLPDLRASITTTLEFLSEVPHVDDSPRDRTNLTHACDHATRLLRALRDVPTGTPDHKPITPLNKKAVAPLAHVLRSATQQMTSSDRALSPVASSLQDASKRVAEWRVDERARLLAAISAGTLRAADAEVALKQIAWVDRVGYHAWRAAAHLAAWDEPERDN